MLGAQRGMHTARSTAGSGVTAGCCAMASGAGGARQVGAGRSAPSQNVFCVSPPARACWEAMRNLARSGAI